MFNVPASLQYTAVYNAICTLYKGFLGSRMTCASLNDPGSETGNVIVTTSQQRQWRSGREPLRFSAIAVDF